MSSSNHIIISSSNKEIHLHFSKEPSPALPFEFKMALVPTNLIGTHEACLPGSNPIDFSSGWNGPPIAVAGFLNDDLYESLPHLCACTPSKHGDLGAIDGHHRLKSAKKSGIKQVPVQIIPLRHPSIDLQTWKKNTNPLTIDQVTSHFKDPHSFTPPKTSKFQVVGTHGFSWHISKYQPTIQISLEDLT